jgi:hypothetical protein
MKAALILLGIWTGIAATAFGCTVDIPVAFTVEDTEGNRLRGLGGSYVDGLDGVTARILCTGSGDGVLNLNKSRRKIEYDLRSWLTGSATPPAWTTTPLRVVAFLNVRNLMWNYGAGVAYSFTSRMTTTFTGPDKKSYRLAMLNPGADTDGGINAAANTPEPTVLVQVYHQPAEGNNRETWTVYPIPEQGGAARAGLIRLASGKTPDTSAGQYDVPFRIVVTRMQ